jgi:hypothetical protein
MRVYGIVVFVMAFGLWCYLTWRPDRRPLKDATAQYVLAIALWPLMFFFIQLFFDGQRMLYRYDIPSAPFTRVVRRRSSVLPSLRRKPQCPPDPS